MSSKPFTFDEVHKAKKSFNKDNIPWYVIDAVNKLLTKNFVKDGPIEFTQDALISEIKSIQHNVTNAELFENHYLDIEDLYESYGWKVTYNKTPYYESNGDSTFTFKNAQG